MFSLFRKKQTPPLAALAVDMHAHWLPGIDDGAPDMEASLALIRGLSELGYRKLIATPHVMADLYPNTPALIRERLEEVRETADKAGLDVELDAAAEYLLDEGFAEKMEAGQLLTLPGNRVLVEFSFVAPPRDYETTLFRLQTKGYRPVLAHPERYLYWHEERGRLGELRERGIELQVNLLSLGNYYGKPVRKAAERLIAGGKVAFLGTDAHHGRHLAALKRLADSRSVGRIITNSAYSIADL